MFYKILDSQLEMIIILNLILRMEKIFFSFENAHFSGKGRQSLHI